MNIPYAERQELNKLSKEIFGVSSKWQKMLEFQELVTKTVKETVPGDNGAPDTEKEVTVPALTPEGAKQYRRKTMTTEEVKAKLLEVKGQIEAAKAKQEEARKQQELNKQIQEKASGTVAL